MTKTMDWWRVVPWWKLPWAAFLIFSYFHAHAEAPVLGAVLAVAGGWEISDFLNLSIKRLDELQAQLKAVLASLDNHHV